MSSSDIDEAIAFHREHSASGDAATVFRWQPKEVFADIPGLESIEPPSAEPFARVIGPVKRRGPENGLILRHGYIVAEWGDTRQVDMTYSATKSYLATVAGLALDRGLIRDVHDRVGDYVHDGSFDSPHNAQITWHHLLIHPDPKNQIDFIVFNSAKAESPVGDPNVRRALYLAIDYDRYFSEVRKGLSTPIGGGIIPPGIVGHNPDAAPTGGVEEAKRLLAEAGYPDGEGFPGFKLTTSLDNGTYGLDGQIFQEMWRQNLGIEVEVELMEGTAFRAFRNSLSDPSADFDAFFIGTGGFDPTNWHVIALTFGGGRWENAEFEELVAQASLATDPDERHELHAEADALLMQDMPVLPYRVNGRGVLVKPWVHNFTEWPQNSPRPLRQDIYIDRE